MAKGQVDFGAYYTKLKTGEPWEEYSRTGDHADIIVKIAGEGGELVFWRGSSYLPYWKTGQGQWAFPVIVPRSGNGTSIMPDKANVYSHAEIIKNDPGEIIVHWRYLSEFSEGNPHQDVDPDNFVEETFTITPDGMVKRVIKKGTAKIDDWNDPAFQTTQFLQLSSGGIKQISLTEPTRSLTQTRMKGNPERGPVIGKPLVRFDFDGGMGDRVEEKISKTRIGIPGNKTLWKKGISGTALEFDGYNTAVAFHPEGVDFTGGSLTLEGWIALGAYPWNWAPLVQQGDNEGFFLGVNSHGYPGFMVKIDTAWEQLTVPDQPPYTDSNHMKLFRWYDLAGTYDKNEGMMRLYVDGVEVARKKVGKNGINGADADIRVGKAGIMRTPTEGTHDTYPSDFGIDGLIDEVRIYDKALSAGPGFSFLFQF